MDFNGVLDLSKKENVYDFHSKIDYANLVKLNFIKDSISVFKGDIVVKATGNSFDNLKGNLLPCRALGVCVPTQDAPTLPITVIKTIVR